MEEKLILLAIITKPHGVRGEVKLHSYTNEPHNLKKYELMYDESYNTYRINKINVTTDNIIAQINEIETRTEAESLKNIKLHIKENQLKSTEEDEFYNYELIGLAVKNLKYEIIGKIIEIYDFGAGPIIEIKSIDGKETMHSFTKEIFSKVNLKEKYVLFTPIIEV